TPATAVRPKRSRANGSIPTRSLARCSGASAWAEVSPWADAERGVHVGQRDVGAGRATGSMISTNSHRLLCRDRGPRSKAERHINRSGHNGGFCTHHTGLTAAEMPKCAGQVPLADQEKLA